MGDHSDKKMALLKLLPTKVHYNPTPLEGNTYLIYVECLNGVTVKIDTSKEHASSGHYQMETLCYSGSAMI